MLVETARLSRVLLAVHIILPPCRGYFLFLGKNNFRNNLKAVYRILLIEVIFYA